MSEKVFIPPHTPILPVKTGVTGNSQTTRGKVDKQNSFEKVFNDQLQKQSQLKFSAHAEKRLQQRNITLDKDSLAQLENAVGKAEAKGAKESLILMNNLAFVVSVPNKTVITAMDQVGMKDNVFTNIDSAIII